MDKKITIPAGIALMVVLAVAGMLAIFSYTAATPVEAAVSEVSADDQTANAAAGILTVTLTTDETIAARTAIAVTLPTGFSAAVGTATVAIGNTNQTPVVTTVDVGVVSFDTVAVITVAAATPVVFTIAITQVTPPIYAGDYSGLAVNGVAGDDVTVVAAVVLTFVTVTTPGEAGILRDVTVGFTPNRNLNADVIVGFPMGTGFEGDYTAAGLGVIVGVTAVAGTVDADANTITIPVTASANGAVAIVISDVRAPGDGDYEVFVGVPGAALEVFDYAVAAYDYEVVFDTVPDKPNKNDEVIIKFDAPGGGIAAGSFITIVLHEDFQVPDDIDESLVTIDGNVMATPIGGSAIPVADANPANVVVDDDAVFDPSDNDTADWLIQIEVGDMAVGDAFPGEQGIAAETEVTVTIAKAAGIKAPLEADPDDGYQVSLSLEEKPGLADLIDTTYQTTSRLITLSSPDGSRGDAIVATAKGWGGKNIDFWLDANADGVRQASEKGLCSQRPILEGNIAECEFDLDSNFVSGHGDPTNANSYCDGSRNPSGQTVRDCNLINARDSDGKTSAVDGEDDVIELEASVSANPAEGNPGDSVTVQVRDFPNAGTAVSNITIGGVDACGETEPACGENLNSRGDADVDIQIPNVDSGLRQLIVYVGTEDEDTTIDVGGGSIIATPATVIPNQDVALVGNGFGTGSDTRITDITLGSDTILDWPMANTNPTTNLSKLDADDLRVDSGGSWSLSIIIPVTQDTADAGFDGSSRTLTVTDSDGRSGETELAFAQRTVSVSPDVGRRGSTISISGQNFPGLNSDGERNIDVDISYDGEGEESVEPDVNGRWQTSIEVPRLATIPSNNLVKVEFGVGFTEIETYGHRVPSSFISLSPVSGPEGSMVTINGEGFGRFESMDELTISGNDVTVVPNPSTDRNGDVSFSFLVPGLDAGTQTVVLDIDGVTASVGFAVTEASGVVGAVTSDVEVALEPLLTEGTLDRVFYFNNATKEWQWHIVDPDFAATNNLDDIVSGAPLWVLVTEDTSAVLNSRTVDFTCAGDDCWNLVTFP